MSVARPYLPEFVERMGVGTTLEFYVAQRLAESGFTVTMEPRRIRRPDEAIDSFRGQVDLSVEGISVEVKSKDCAFTSGLDFPFDPVTICAYKGGDLTTSPFVIVSQLTGGMVVSLPSHPRFLRRQMDGRRGYSFDVVSASRHGLCGFRDLCRWLEYALDGQV